MTSKNLPGILRAACVATVLMLTAHPVVSQGIATTTYGYDEAGNKTRQTDALGRTTHWVHDGKNRVTQRVLPDGSRESVSYDQAGNLVGKSTFAGERLTFQFDLNDRLQGQVTSAGAGSNQAVPGSSVIFRYTATGRLASRHEQGPTSLAGEQSYRYDALDRVIGVTSPIGQIAYGRNEAGHIIERSVGGAGTTRYEYDAVGRMTRVVAPDGRITVYSYDAASRLDRVERSLRDREGQAQSLLTHYGYDNADRVRTIAHLHRHGAALSLLAGQVLTRTTGGAIIQIETDRSNGTSSTTGAISGRLDVIQQFEYDGLGRLTREKRIDPGGTTDTRYEYDAVGNRTRKSLGRASGTEITTYQYDEADRLLDETTTLPAGGANTIRYTWDANGNLASKVQAGSVTLYRFDAQNRLIDLRKGSTAPQAEAANPLVRYAYDTAGNRVRKWAVGERTYLIDSEEPFSQVLREAGPGYSVDYVRGIGLIRQQRVASGVSEDIFPLPGHLGTSLGAVNLDGDIVEQVDAEAFGSIEVASTSRQPHLFAGEYWDQDSELLYLRARWYDPKVGRFISPDPFQGIQEDPRSLNRYAYSYSDPVHRLDRSGLMSMAETNVVLNNISMAYTAASIAFDIATGNYVGAAEDIATDLVCAKFGKALCQKAGQQLKVFCNAIHCNRVLAHLELGGLPSGASLSKNLELIGIRKPSGSQAHHIVGAVTEFGQRTRAQLANHNISVNSPANGVFLPGCGPTTNVIGMIHCGKHTEAYEREVFNRINHLGKREDIISALDDIRRELLSNNFVVLNVRSLP
jgi:RHS repeat-associated protein